MVYVDGVLFKKGHSMVWSSPCQGSKLGSLLFLIQINNLTNIKQLFTEVEWNSDIQHFHRH